MPHCYAADSGTVRINGLWPNSRIYIDSKPAAAKDGALSVAAGTHQIQVEQFRWPEKGQNFTQEAANLSGVYVFRCCVQIQNGQNAEVQIKALPVYPTSAGAFASDWGAFAPVGPTGSMGPPGKAADLTQSIGTEDAFQMLRDALLSELGNVRSRLQSTGAQQLQRWRAAPNSRNYWYGPPQGLARRNVVGCAPGPTGRPGPPGLAGDLFRLKDGHNQLLFKRAVDELQLSQLKSEIDRINQANQQRTQRRVSIEDAVKPVPIYTSFWKNHLDAEFAKFRFVEADRKPAFLSEPYGAMGPDGPRGKDGLATGTDSPTAAVIFTEDQVRSLLSRLATDEQITQQKTQLGDGIQNLKAFSTTNTDSSSCLDTKG